MEPSQANFCHPYQPYDIQLEFMSHLYRCIQEKKVGIFESPTGTGKSLSLICGALTWLRDHERHALDSTLNAESGGDQDDWLVRAETAVRRREMLLAREELEHKLATLREEEARQKQKTFDSRFSKKPRIVESSASEHLLNDDEFLVDDYNSEAEEKATVQSTSTGFSSSTQSLLDKLQKPTKENMEQPEEDRLKVIFCSRTHSQLTQFVNELRRVKPPPSVPTAVEDFTPGSEFEEGIKHLALGSRKNLCINPKVARLSSPTAINERCLELQKPGTAKDKKCPYLPSKDDREKVDSFRDKAIAQIRDIEDLAHLGKRMDLCPYYASRSAIASAEILTLPYPLLLQRSARDALGVSVKDNVVVIDEAHNLTDAIADTFSIALRLSQLEQALQQVTAYAMRFKNRLKGKNRVYVTQVLRLLRSLADCLRGVAQKSSSGQVTTTATQLMSGKGVDQIRPHKLLRYLHESKLCHKVESYTEVQKDADDDGQGKGVLMQFQNFMSVLMNPDEEGRFFVERHDGDIIVRYTLLDPREHFREIVAEARAVILAGGTMSPMSDYSNYLFSYLEKDRLETFSFGHVIPSTHLFAQAVVKGPSNVEFDFTFEKRGSEGTILELADLIYRTCKVVPDGVVVFFPSYEYLAQVVAVWQKLPLGRPLMKALGETKVTFQESKGVSVDELLRDYASAVDSGKGALLLSVVGGKLSEGINFSDKLGRAVIAVGLPFPNANGAEWKAKMQHIEGLRYQQCKREAMLPQGQWQVEAKKASRDYYENACMRAVNQSIGRVIRHRNDYAAILMVDRRFATDRIRQKLPGWIQGSMERGVDSWGDVERGLIDFFRTKL
ncbi:chromosome transmission fidelity protein 1 [Capronia coronata CBS 617.96]|uniref:ATP-dependent DNA helicase CHL1 n=1 Tax=Capronia coronata CBS 617.96 TaxID=1182541 RepID=W9ZM76_9EURO|nr:chromosome transmission fidelity protein 1 [Capronia coronata CBS 617.96]EXJ95594.1 chromosome transmission fidelity protein 1 [Capronia coronata CBS 617.96]